MAWRQECKIEPGALWLLSESVTEGIIKRTQSSYWGWALNNSGRHDLAGDVMCQ